MVTQLNYFDLWDIFINELIGGVWLSIIVVFILISWAAIKFRWNYPVSIMIMFLYLSIVYAATGIQLVWAFVVLAVSAIFYYRLTKVMA